MAIVKTVALVVAGGLVAALSLSAGCQATGNTPAAAQSGKVTGKVYYLQRIALPKETKLVVKLVDTTDSRKPKTMDTMSRTIGSKTPVDFTLSFNPGAIKDNGVYQVTATLELPGGKIWWHEQSYPVLSGGAPNYVEIRVYPKMQ